MAANHTWTTRALAALLIAALQTNAFAALPAPPTSPAPIHNFGYDANGNLSTVTTPNPTGGTAYTTTSLYNTLEQQTQSTDARSKTTLLGHDLRDNIVQVTDPRGLATGTLVNGFDQTTQQASPDTGTTVYTYYDAAGNLTQATDSRGVRTSYTYDGLNRLTSANHFGTGFATQKFIWTYDQTAAPQTYGAGRLSGLTFPGGSARYGYDQWGNLVYADQQLPASSPYFHLAISQTLGFGYDLANRPASLTYPSGWVVKYPRNAGGQITGITVQQSAGAAAQPLITGMHWRADGQVDHWLWQTGATTVADDRVFDQWGRVVRYTLGNTVRDLSYDAAGRIVDYTHYNATTGTATPALDETFGYDALDRLTTVIGNTSTWTYGYDDNGNRTFATLDGSPQQNYTADPASNRLQSITSTSQTRSFVYDAEGNTTSDSNSTGGSYSASYDAVGHLATLTKGGTTNSYLYDNNGLRLLKTSGSFASTVVFAYDPRNGHLLGEYDKAGNVQKEYVWLGNAVVAVLTPDPSGPTTKPPLAYYVYTDHLGTPQVVVDSANRVRWTWMTEPFGTTAPTTTVLGAFTLNLRFPGQYYDQESGLHYNGHRSYDPTTGGYIESDPIGLQGGINTYAYVGSNPVSRSDPSGLFFTSVDAACLQNPSLCAEVMGDMVKNAAATTGNKCVEALANQIGDGYQRVANFAMVAQFASFAGAAVGVERAVGSTAGEAAGPGFDTANLESKLQGYLLDPAHPQNQTKAVWFDQALGFNKDNWQDLASQLKFDEATATQTKVGQYGTTYEQVIPVAGANGNTVNATFVFMKDNNGVVRLVTGIPTKR